MPRKKSIKTPKPNSGDAILKEKIESFQRKMHDTLIEMDILEKKNINIMDNLIKTIKMGMFSDLKQMKMGDFLKTFEKLSRFSDFKGSDNTRMLAAKGIDAKNDGDTSNDSGLGREGPITSSNAEVRTIPSARSRRTLRSRSTSNHRLGISKMSNDASRKSRRKMNRRKALSVDRNLLKSTTSVNFLRYPKPGEKILSESGSPIMALAITNTFANINIPTRDGGVLCLTSKKLIDNEVSKNLVKTLDEDGLNQIRILHTNLKKIKELVLK